MNHLVKNEKEICIVTYSALKYLFVEKKNVNEKKTKIDNLKCL